MRGKKVWRCGCEVCQKFNRHPLAFLSPHALQRANCDVCGDKRTMIGYVPPLLTEFLGYQKMCEYCRNSITGHVADGINTDGWRLCWTQDSDEALKWAMLCWLRNSHWNEAFHCAIDGYANREEQFWGELDKNPEKREYWMAHGNQEIRIELHERYGM